MEKVMILCRSMTQAQRGQRLLERSGIVSTTVKAPLHLTRSGCGYGLVLRRHAAEAARLLKEAGLLNGKIYQWENESWTEASYDLS